MSNCQNCEKLIPESGITYGIDPMALCPCKNPFPYKRLDNNLNKPVVITTTLLDLKMRTIQAKIDILKLIRDKYSHVTWTNPSPFIVIDSELQRLNEKLQELTK